MSLNKSLKQNMAGHGEMVVKAMSIQFFLSMTIVMQVIVVIISVKGTLFPGSEIMSGIAGTCAEIIAGLYGITLAGYTFFLSRMDALVASDMTLDYIVTNVKMRYKYIIWYLTFNVLMTLFTSIFLMYFPAPGGEKLSFFYRLFCNEFIVFVATSIIMILYYSVSVIEPNCLEKEAQKQKKRLSRSFGKEGDIMAFISMYDKIEERCNAMIPANVLSQLQENKGKHFEYTIELLYETKPLMRPVLPEIRRIHRYYECVVNCTPMTVSWEMCEAAQRVLVILNEKE